MLLRSKVQCARLHRFAQVWDAALRAVCRARGVQSMPSFVHLMHISVGGLSRKPVRARCPGPLHVYRSVPKGLPPILKTIISELLSFLRRLPQWDAASPCVQAKQGIAAVLVSKALQQCTSALLFRLHSVRKLTRVGTRQTRLIPFQLTFTCSKSDGFRG